MKNTFLWKFLVTMWHRLVTLYHRIADPVVRRLFRIKRQKVIIAVVYFFILLFAYTALAKAFMYPVSYRDMTRSPILKHMAKPVFFLLPLTELSICVLLFLDQTRLMGLKATIIIMTLFTFYVALIVFVIKDTPCSCGGIIRELSWRNHLIFNVSCMLLAWWAFRLQKQLPDHRSIQQKVKLSY